ncbi:MAG: DUF1549 domain-containing protein, partial [Planctomycetia bacterium]
MRRYSGLAALAGTAAVVLGLTVPAGFLAPVAAAPPEGSSAKSKLEELRKQREREKPAQRAAPVKNDAKNDAKFPWATPDDVTYIDSTLDEEWKAVGFPVSERCTDGEFLRRASLDVIGRVPSMEEIEQFDKTPAATRREDLINRLLASDEYGKHWANIWSKLMVTGGNDGGNNQDVNPGALRSWLEKEFNRNTPWNTVVTELLTATGRWDENGAVNFIIANNMDNSSVQTTSFMTRLFLGVQSQCTECHDHPWNEWKQEQFHGMNAFFLGTKEMRATTTTMGGQLTTDYYSLVEMPMQDSDQKGAFFERRNGLTVFTPPTYIDGRDVQGLVRGEKARVKDALPAVADVSEAAQLRLLDETAEAGEPIFLRKELAKAMTADDNPYFARAMVNRLWYNYFGHSFVKNVDDFENGQDEPTIPVLLDKLSEDFRVTGYDLKRLTRWICTSKAYSLSSKMKGKDG